MFNKKISQHIYGRLLDLTENKPLFDNKYDSFNATPTTELPDFVVNAYIFTN